GHRRTQPRLARQFQEGAYPGMRIVGCSIKSCRAADFRQACPVRDHNGATEAHGFKRRQPEPFHKGGKCEAKTVLQQGSKGVVSDASQNRDIRCRVTRPRTREYLGVAGTHDSDAKSMLAKSLCQIEN